MSTSDWQASDCRDAPLTLRYKAEPIARALVNSANLPLSARQLQVAERIITALWLEFHGAGRATSVSLRKEHYANRSGSLYTYAGVKPSIEALASAGLIHLNKTPPGSNRKRQSTIWLPVHIGRGLPSPGGVVVDYEPEDLVLLRDANGWPIPIPPTEQVARMQTDGRLLFEAYSTMRIDVAGAKRLGTLLIVETASGNRVVTNDLDRAPCRIFNETLKHGGRFYRVFWQQLPKSFRANIRVDGQETVEEDFPQLHPTLLYAKAGKSYDPSTQDVYSFAGDKGRPLAKKVLNILINAPRRDIALGAIRNELADARAQDCAPAFMKADDLVLAAERHNKPIARFFGTGAGRWLQREDSDMARTVTMRLLRKHGVAPLGVHDSFIVPRRLQGVLQEAMHAALESALGKLKRSA